MSDPIIACFASEFARFFALLEKQAESCPEELWGKKTVGYPFWQHHLHTLCCLEIYARAEGALLWPQRYDHKVVMLEFTPSEAVSKAEMRALALEMGNTAKTFIEAQTTASLSLQHAGLYAFTKKEMTIQNALIALIRHLCYHLGGCDTLLREHGLPGVY